MMMSIYGSFGCILSWVSASHPRSRPKRAVAYAVVNAGSKFPSIHGAISILPTRVLGIGKRMLLFLLSAECVFSWRHCCTLHCDGRIGSSSRLRRRILAPGGILLMKTQNVTRWLWTGIVILPIGTRIEEASSRMTARKFSDS